MNDIRSNDVNSNHVARVRGSIVRFSGALAHPQRAIVNLRACSAAIRIVEQRQCDEFIVGVMLSRRRQRTVAKHISTVKQMAIIELTAHFDARNRELRAVPPIAVRVGALDRSTT